MTREEIFKVVSQNDSTVLSYKDRGPWGDNRYRGNCSGWIHAFLCWKYKVQKLAELFAGSGTGSDVAKDLGVTYIGADLNPNPVRSNILTVDAISDEVPIEFMDADFLFMHPPYGAEIKIPYAGSMWKDPTGELSKKDLGQMKWDVFMAELNKVVMKYYSAMAYGSRMGILMGDVRRNGLHSMLTDIVKPGELDQIIIKMQHNTCSERANASYSTKNFVPLVHEYLLVLKKNGLIGIRYQIPVKREKDVRDMNSPSWRDVVYSCLKEKGAKSLSEIYQMIDGHEKAKKNPHWKEKIRQVLQMNPCFRNEALGVWSAV